MKNNQEKMALNIQLFAEESDASMDGSAETEQKVQDDNSKEEKKEKTYSRDEVNKMLNAERNKLRKELEKEFQTEKSEAEKLAKMNTEQKINYELEQEKKKNQELTSQLNELTLKETAKNYAKDKGLPIDYIDLLDFKTESADSVREKIDKMSGVRIKDLEVSLNERLKQNPPKAVDGKKETEDPYLKGFKDYYKKLNSKK